MACAHLRAGTSFIITGFTESIIKSPSSLFKACLHLDLVRRCCFGLDPLCPGRGRRTKDLTPKLHAFTPHHQSPARRTSTDTSTDELTVLWMSTPTPRHPPQKDKPLGLQPSPQKVVRPPKHTPTTEPQEVVGALGNIHKPYRLHQSCLRLTGVGLGARRVSEVPSRFVSVRCGLDRALELVMFAEAWWGAPSR